MKLECWESISTHFTTFPDLELPFLNILTFFFIFLFFQFFEKDWNKLEWLKIWLEWSLEWLCWPQLRPNCHSNECVSNRLTDGPTEWYIESLHATKKGGPSPLSGREPYSIWHDFETIRTLQLMCDEVGPNLLASARQRNLMMKSLWSF